MSEPRYAVRSDSPVTFYLIADPAIFYMVFVSRGGSNFRHYAVDKVRSTVMAARLVSLLNAPVPSYYPGRYIMDGDDDHVFKDTYAIVGEPLLYKIMPFPGLDKIKDIKLDKLVGMLNYQEHNDQQISKIVRRVYPPLHTVLE